MSVFDNVINGASNFFAPQDSNPVPEGAPGFANWRNNMAQMSENSPYAQTAAREAAAQPQAIAQLRQKNLSAPPVGQPPMPQGAPSVPQKPPANVISGITKALEANKTPQPSAAQTAMQPPVPQGIAPAMSPISAPQQAQVPMPADSGISAPPAQIAQDPSFTSPGGSPMVGPSASSMAQPNAGGMPQDQEVIPGVMSNPNEAPPEQTAVAQQTEEALHNDDPQVFTSAIAGMGNIDPSHIPAGTALQAAALKGQEYLRGQTQDGQPIYECPLSKKPCGRQTFWQRLANFFKLQLGAGHPQEIQAQNAQLDKMDPIASQSNPYSGAATQAPQAQTTPTGGFSQALNRPPGMFSQATPNQPIQGI